jgi:hypothetical protein
MNRCARAIVAVTAGLLPITTMWSGPAGAQSTRPAVSAFGADVVLNGEALVPPTPTAVVETPTGDASETLIDIPADPVVVSGTLTATANAHDAPDITSGLTVVPQELEGPYDARALAQVEQLGVAYDVAATDVPLVSAALIRSEAVVTCSPTPTFAATSEIIDLAIGGTAVPVNGPVQDLIDAVGDALEQTGLNAVVDVQRNVVTELEGGGIAVDALVITLLAAAGETPLGVIHIAHAELGAGACVPEPAAVVPEVLPRTGTGPTRALIGSAILVAAVGGLTLRRRSGRADLEGAAIGERRRPGDAGEVLAQHRR